MRTWFVLCVVGSLCLLGMSVVPGALSQAAWLLFFLAIAAAFLLVPVIILVYLLSLVIRGPLFPPIPVFCKRLFGRSRYDPILLLAMIAVLAATLSLAVFAIPQRLAFWASRSAFEYELAGLTEPQDRSTMERRLGLYYVDQVGVDPRGGAYFRVYWGSDGIGPDIVSYGFAYRPNDEGSPFGRCSYRHTRILGDWYVFSASDDFF